MVNATMILVVDDDDDIRELLVSALEGRGFPVEQACDGEAAIASLQSHQHPCLMLLDLVMPGMDGWTVLEQMKAHAIRDVPVCVMTALPERAPTDVAATIRKPFELSELVAVAERYCPARRSVQG